MDLLLMILTSMILIISALVGVAFFTLLERKILGYIHNRKGPNKLGVCGILQPFSDAIKLFSKEQNNPLMSNFMIFLFSPISNLFISLLLWVCIPFYSMNLNFSFSLLFFLCGSSLGVYTIMMAGWSSNSNYALLGSLRSVAQMISYEVSLVLILMSFLFLVYGFNMLMLMEYQKFLWFIFLFIPLSMMMVVSLLAETNRTPFDFAEGESELVSGFNVEYSSGEFAMIFMSEYASIMLISVILSFFFFSGSFNLLFFLKVMVIVFLWVWVRGTFPRYRYDKLMYLAWKIYLPVSLNLLLLYFSLIIISMIFIM
uniref:NADH-ubiquinone oxidoreductase chain 1 n=1 Tax=Phloeotribus sp. BMNH 1047247 TaxID=1903799 RepID=A0A343A5I2_9CUCU|nr:NADH dehydrogenase subunit 1 [Phloeotribus sp. BMNH 1047247]